MRTPTRLTVLTTLALAAANLSAQDRPEQIARKVTVLDLSGSPAERGFAHGQALKAQIRENLREFKLDLEKTYKIEAKTFLQRFLADTDFIPAIEKWTPGLLDEVRGIAKGAEVPFDEVYAFQLADEIWSMGNWTLRDKCTAVAVDRRGDQPTLVAQNMDLPRFYHKVPTLLRVRREGGPDTMVLTCPGLIGVNGMNSASVAICCNTLLQLRPSREGLPCLFVVRGVLERRSLADAEAWLKRIPHAVGQNYTLGGTAHARAFECSAGAKIQFRPDPKGDFTYHTNHPLVNTDWHPDDVARCQKVDKLPQQGLRVCHRFAALEQRVGRGQPITIETIQATLASKDHAPGSICGDWNYCCTIFVLKDKPVLLMAPGRPDRIAFQRFTF